MPLTPPVTVIHPALLVAPQTQLDPVVMLNEPVPPLLGAEPLVAPSVKVHDAACVMV